jgi:hypothetical protein
LFSGEAWCIDYQSRDNNVCLWPLFFEYSNNSNIVWCFGFLHYSREFLVAPWILLWSHIASLCKGCLSHFWNKSTCDAMRWCLHQKRLERAFWVQLEVSDMYALANFLHLAFEILCFKNWSDNNNSFPSPLLQCDYNFVTNWEKQMRETTTPNKGWS